MLLVQLKVSNYALIDEMSLDFSSGFNVLTGETGAGKSIIVDTVMLLLGARAKVEDIRKGERSALVEGVFEVAENHKALSLKSFRRDGNRKRDNSNSYQRTPRDR